ncbi:MAG TPA: response regulator, partial [Chromatiales bacterium]|nr:response regulator [Chromatiales bacterium]HEX22117.1 response regulator [Chromatiales bacterium]
MNILIVDDKLENLYLLRVLLGSKGYDVTEATNGKEALERARETPPALIISDILMPVMDGFALCRAWKADARLASIPFIFYTATYTEPKDKEFALSLGADRFLVKPQEGSVLLGEVESALLAGELAGKQAG